VGEIDLSAAVEAGRAAVEAEHDLHWSDDVKIEAAVRAAAPFIERAVREQDRALTGKNPAPGEVAYRIEVWPHDSGANGEEWSVGTQSAADLARELRRLADRVERDWADPECPFLDHRTEPADA
jgi:hypothetical protein